MVMVMALHAASRRLLHSMRYVCWHDSDNLAIDAKKHVPVNALLWKTLILGISCNRWPIDDWCVSASRWLHACILHLNEFVWCGEVKVCGWSTHLALLSQLICLLWKITLHSFEPFNRELLVLIHLHLSRCACRRHCSSVFTCVQSQCARTKTKFIVS